jgi:transposase
MEQPVSAAWERGSFGVILRAYRHGAHLSQEELAARAELSERTVRSLEAGRVQSPHTDTVRLLADALELSQADRKRWFEAARAMNHLRPEPAITGAGGQVGPPDDAHAALSLNECGSGSGSKNARDVSPTGKFQAEPSALCPRGNRSTGQVAKYVDVTGAAVQASANQGGHEAGMRSDGGLTGVDRRELAELRRENRRLREDVEILKRATAIFAAAAR